MTESNAITIDQLHRWARRRRASANDEYSHDGRGGYGDIAGAIEVCDELLRLTDAEEIDSDYDWMADCADD